MKDYLTLAEIKSWCKTYGQRKAYNEPVNTFGILDKLKELIESHNRKKERKKALEDKNSRNIAIVGIDKKSMEVKTKVIKIKLEYNTIGSSQVVSFDTQRKIDDVKKEYKNKLRDCRIRVYTLSQKDDMDKWIEFESNYLKSLIEKRLQ